MKRKKGSEKNFGLLPPVATPSSSCSTTFQGKKETALYTQDGFFFTEEGSQQQPRTERSATEAQSDRPTPVQ